MLILFINNNNFKLSIVRSSCSMLHLSFQLENANPDEFRILRDPLFLSLSLYFEADEPLSLAIPFRLPLVRLKSFLPFFFG